MATLVSALLFVVPHSTTTTVFCMSRSQNRNHDDTYYNMITGAPFNRKCAFDAMDYGLGVSANSLQLVRMPFARCLQVWSIARSFSVHPYVKRTAHILSGCECTCRGATAWAPSSILTAS